MAKKSIFKRLYISVCTLVLLYGFVLSILLTNTLFLSIGPLSLTAITLLLQGYIFSWQLAPLKKSLAAIENGISAFNDNDFSLTIHNQQFVEIEQLVVIYNELASTLRSERMDIFQRELLLDTVIQSTPVALILTNKNDSVVYSNIAAKQLLKQNKKIEGANFKKLQEHLSPALQQATLTKKTGLITETSNDILVTYTVDCRQFMLNGREHILYLYKNMTHEISRKESEMWKQVIRLISHELNNSLAPISSLTRSAQKILKQPEHIHMLNDVLETIGNRTHHLHDFISQYAKFARLPKPQVRTVDLSSFFKQIKTLVGVACYIDVVRESASFDSAQIEQVVINLIKNAKESGSELSEVSFTLKQQANRLNFIVNDRGTGLTEVQQQQALLPFFTTKQTGTGIGLALCNEIVSNHDGQLRLTNRDHGGLSVSFALELKD
jgi:nitrogen fixation/metabolism regulation signal transduction histidine kinase